MNDKQFANLIVDKLALPEKSQARQFHSNNGLATSRLGEADEIWRLFVRYNLDTGGMKSSIVENQWNKIDTDNILKRRDKLVEGLGRLRKEKCYENFTVFCPMRFKKGDGFEKKGCTVPDCAVIDLTRSISWHRRHYRIAKVIAECAKRLLVDNQTVYHANLNNLVSSIWDKYRGKHREWRQLATKEFVSFFDNIRDYGNPPKVIIWMLSDLSSPVHQVNHWPDIDLSQLTPIDTHVKRLVARFGWVSILTNENIRSKLSNLYPEEPRKLDFALYRLGGASEENICSKDPKCGECRERFREIYDACTSTDKKRV